MSFLSVLSEIEKDIGIGLGVLKPLAPTLGAIPGFGSVFTIIFDVVTAVEALISQPGSGPAKKKKATAIIQAVLPDINPATLAALIDDTVGSLNSLQKVSTAAASLAPAKT